MNILEDSIASGDIYVEDYINYVSVERNGEAFTVNIVPTSPEVSIVTEPQEELQEPPEQLFMEEPEDRAIFNRDIEPGFARLIITLCLCWGFVISLLW